MSINNCICTLDSTWYTLFYYITCDFHFLCECLKVIFEIFWGSPSQQGSLQFERNRNHVDKAAKVFSVADEFLVHVFKAYLSVSVCTAKTTLQSTSDAISHEA